MFSLRNISIKRKLKLIILLISSISLLIAFMFFLSYDIINYKKKLANQLWILASIAGQNNTAAITFNDAQVAKELLHSLQAHKNILYACIFNANQDTLASYIRENTSQKVIFPHSQKEEIIFGENTIEVFKDITLENEVIGSIYICSDLNELYSRVKRYISIIFIILLISLIIAFILSTQLQQIILQPILQLAHTAREISEKKDYNISMQKRNNDEVGRLVDDFNDMVKQIGKQNTELIQAKEVAEKAKKTEERFLANVSHEIRTPINVITGMSQLLLNMDVPDEQKKYLNAIYSSSKNLLVIINDILDMSKVAAGEMTFEYIGFRAEELLISLIDTFEHKAKEKKLFLHYVIDTPAKHILLGDTVRLNQILVNLINNAIKFTHQGEIKISCSTVNESENEIKLLFSVSDTGIGIQEEQLNTIFESFKQADASITREFGGTGLGLSISKQLVELQGGKIEVESELNKGSIFRFQLTFKKGTEKNLPKTNFVSSAEKIKQKENIAAIAMPAVKVLLVEDHVFNQLLAVSIMEKWGFKIDIAENGKIAIDKLQKTNHYDIILMDIKMPVLDGIETTKIIRKELKNDIPIIAFTANATEAENKKCLQIGMNDYITKPYEQKTLYNKIATLLKYKFPDFEHINAVANTPQNKHTLYDLSLLKKVSEGNNEFVVKMIKVFLDTTSEALKSMQMYHNQKNWGKLAEIAHKMKPSIDHLTISSITREIQLLEQNAKAETNLDKIPSFIEKIDTVCKQVFIELEEEIKLLI